MVKYWKCHSFAAVGGIAIALLLYVNFDRSDVIDYGAQSKSYLKPAKVRPGDQVNICLDDVTWKRLCPSVVTQTVVDVDGRYNDYGTHTVSRPWKTGKLPPKCRAWTVPKLPAGKATLTGYMFSQCGPLDYRWPITTKFPDIQFMVLPPVEESLMSPMRWNGMGGQPR